MDNKFYVSYSYSQDLNNYVRQLRNKFKFQFGMDTLEMSKKYFPEDFLKSVLNAPNDTYAESLVLEYWQKTRRKDFNEVVTQKAEEFNQYLYDNQSKIIETLENLYKKKYPFINKINVFLTTFYRCPYKNPYWFMSYSNCTNEKLKEVTIHEMNHFMFYYYWEKKLRAIINERQFENLKEAVAVLTCADPDNENKYKTEVLPIQNFIRQNSEKSLKEIIDLVIKNKILDQIK